MSYRRQVGWASLALCPSSHRLFKANWNSTIGGLQKIGKALMLPVSVLPVAGILLGLGASIAGTEGLAPWLMDGLFPYSMRGTTRTRRSAMAFANLVLISFKTVPGNSP